MMGDRSSDRGEMKAILLQQELDRLRLGLTGLRNIVQSAIDDLENGDIDSAIEQLKQLVQ